MIFTAISDEPLRRAETRRARCRSKIGVVSVKFFMSLNSFDPSMSRTGSVYRCDGTDSIDRWIRVDCGLLGICRTDANEARCMYSSIAYH